jgi:hypothetical protein
MSPVPDARRVRRLLRWYPRSWRDRYGEEFGELLIAELAERPRDWRRTSDVIASGVLARCTTAGLTRHGLPPAEQILAGLTALGCALTTLLAFGVAMLSQLATGWQWASPPSASVAIATLVMAAGAAGLGTIAVAALLPIGWHVAVAVLRRDRRLARPACLALGCAVAFAAGARHFQNSWPGTGGTGAQHLLVPAGPAAFCWAATLSVTSYWAHPMLLSRFPLPEVAWMALSPLAAGGLVSGLVLVVRRLAMPARLLGYLAFLAAWASAAAAVFLAGAASWVLGHGQDGLFRPGLVDGCGMLIMALAVAVALRSAAGVLRARRALAVSSRTSG